LPSLGFANIYFFLYSFVADHWQYLACLGIITPCASGIVLLAGQLKSWQPWFERGTIALLAGTLFFLTWQQSQMYSNAETLYRTTITRNPACWLAYDHLIDTLYQANRIAEAMNLFEEELRINPAEAHYNLGFALLRKGRTSEAIDQYEQALRINPDYTEVRNNLASALVMTGRFSEAIDQCNEVLRIDPNSSEAHDNLGNALAQTGRASEAIDHYRQTLRMSPNSSDAHSNLGAALALMGRIPEAIEELKSAVRINPNNTDARNNLTKVEALQKSSQEKK